MFIKYQLILMYDNIKKIYNSFKKFKFIDRKSQKKFRTLPELFVYMHKKFVVFKLFDCNDTTFCIHSEKALAI